MLVPWTLLSGVHNTLSHCVQRLLSLCGNIHIWSKRPSGNRTNDYLPDSPLWAAHRFLYNNDDNNNNNYNNNNNNNNDNDDNDNDNDNKNNNNNNEIIIMMMIITTITRIIMCLYCDTNKRNTKANYPLTQYTTKLWLINLSQKLIPQSILCHATGVPCYSTNIPSFR